MSMESEKSPHTWQSTFQNLGTPLHHVEFVVLDLETSGGSPQLGAGITEIGAMRVRGGEVLGTFTTLINPGHPIPAFITELTGIDAFTVENAPRIEEVLPDLIEFVGGDETIFVAQNAPFDLSFLKASAKTHGYAWPAQKILDTAILARRVLTREEAPNCKLGTLAQIFNTEVKPTHRALDDVKATIDVMHGLFERLAGFDVYTLEELFNFSQKRKSPAKERPTSA